MHYLALDIGSSFIKAAIIDLVDGNIHDSRISSQIPKMDAPSGRFEVDAESLFREVEQLVKEYTAEYQGLIAGILLSTQMHGFVLAGPDGTPRSPYISWQDERCLEKAPGTECSYLEIMEEMIPREEMAESSVYLKPYLAMCNLYTMLRQGYEPPPHTHFCTLGSYLILRLTGSHICHLTNAGPTGFANTVRGVWNRKLIDRTGCGAFVFPQICDDLRVCGYYRFGGVEIPVYPDIGDHQTCALGVLARPEKDVIINIGTAGQIARISRQFVPGEYESRPFFDGCYLNTVSRMPGGRNLDVVVNFLADAFRYISNRDISAKDIWSRAVESMTELESHGLAVDTSFHKTERGSSGSITGITFDNLTVHNLFAACFTDIGQAYSDCILRVCPDRKGVERLVFSGGLLSKTPLLRQAICATTELPTAIMREENAVYIGLYRIALVCAGICRNLEQTAEDSVYSLYEYGSTHLKTDAII